MVASHKTPWWRPDNHADRRPFLLLRGRVAAALRGYFLGNDFLEVETAALQVSPGNETHLHAFSTDLTSPEGAGLPLYLHTSPEFACKKLLAAGEARIFTLAQVFRNRERGALHHPAFTMLEWYRANESYDAAMDDCAEILRIAAQAAGATEFVFRGRHCCASAPKRLTVAEAFARYAGIDLLATLDGSSGNVERLAGAAEAAGVRIAADDTWSDIFSKVLVQFVEPQLGSPEPTLLTEYPVLEAALARPKPGDPRVAERFELYVCGVELANGFGELTDAAEQRRRFADQMAEKARRYGETYPLDEDFLTALAAMPPASGVALGFDRLVMLAGGAQHIEQVIWTPVADFGD